MYDAQKGHKKPSYFDFQLCDAWNVSTEVMKNTSGGKRHGIHGLCLSFISNLSAADHNPYGTGKFFRQCNFEEQTKYKKILENAHKIICAQPHWKQQTRQMHTSKLSINKCLESNEPNLPL